MAVNGLVKVYFADGVHLIYSYQDGYFWSKERISVPSAYGRKRVNLLGFMNAVTYETERVTEWNVACEMPTQVVVKHAARGSILCTNTA